MNQITDDLNFPEMDYYMNEELCDVVFIIEGQRIPAPKQLLSVKSRVFRAMFSGNFREGEDNVIPIEDTTVEAFKTFIRFILCDQLVFSDDNDFELIGQVFRLSDKYEVFRLSNKVSEFLKPQINLANLRTIARIAFYNNMEQLMLTVMDFCKDNLSYLIHIEDVQKLSEINYYTNNLLLDEFTSDRVPDADHLVKFIIGKKNVYVKCTVSRKADFPITHVENCGNCQRVIVGSFEAFKVLIGFLYFNRLILKDKNDFQLIQEVCEMTERYKVKGLLDEISADLQNRITFENLSQISVIILNFQITELMEKVIEFIQLNIEELIQRDVEELTSKRNSDLELIRNICKVIEMYNISIGLIERLAVLLGKCLTFDNLVIIYKIAVDYKIQDLITNIKCFINHNIEELSGKDIKDLIEMNNSMNNTLLEVMAKHLSNK